MQRTWLPLLLACIAAVPLMAQKTAPVQLRIDVSAGRHLIDPNIYGIVAYGLDPAFAAEIKVPNVRWGGDATTRYNWMVDSSNSGFDWYFMGGSGESKPVPGAGVDKIVKTFGGVGAKSLVTIPIIPFVNKSAEWSCSFPVAGYGAQKATNPYKKVNGGACGNSLAADGKQLTDRDVHANHIDNSVALQATWVQHLTATFGTAAKGGVAFYQLDNEPAGWGNTHRDVLPNGLPYNRIVALGQQYAVAIKQADSTAMVMGPSDYTLGGWIGKPADQDGLFAGQYYLREMAAYDKQHGGRLLDFFDEHYYPEFTDVASQLASTRTLWDANYNGGTWVEKDVFHGPMRLIPRFKQWIAQYDPRTKLAFSEYSIDSGKKQISDALAEADVLGIFGRGGVAFANMWSAPKPDDPIAFAFRMYRNFDGKGGMFGESAVSARSSDEKALAAFAAVRAADGAVTLVVLNKTGAAIDAVLSLENFSAKPNVAAYEYSGANLTQIVARAISRADGRRLRNSFPAYSATVMVFKAQVRTGARVVRSSPGASLRPARTGSF